MVKMYKEKGAVKWCLCKIIAEYEGKIWLHNLHSGSMPVGRKSKFEFRDAGSYIHELIVKED